MRPGQQRHLAHVLEVPHRDEVLEPVDLPQRDGERQHHRKPGVDRAGDEIRRKDRRVPSRDDADREVEAHDRVDREDERRRESREEQIDVLVPLPVTRRSPPAERQEAVGHLQTAMLRLVAQRREIRDQSDVPEQQRDREVGRDREHVPDQRTPELRPDRHAVRYGNSQYAASQGRPV